MMLQFDPSFVILLAINRCIWLKKEANLVLRLFILLESFGGQNNGVQKNKNHK